MGAVGRTSTFRPELHGVRGIALALVVCFHLFANGRVSGGIDIFLTITGFLFTASLLRRITENNGRLDLGRHFRRIAQRILPPALLVAVVTAIGALFILPRTRWLQAVDEARASILYHENWQLIWSQLSYEAGGVATSPFQHYWSLSIQGQFHLIWPFVILAAVWLARRAGWRPYRVTLIVVSGIFLASFIYANYLTATQPEVSYFHSGTRVWQLALGGLAGLILPKVKLTMGWRIACGWLGLALIATCGLILDGAAHFPGYQSLWPVGGLFLILVAGYTGSRFAADRIFVQRPVTFIADISYSLYLWHWPLFIFYLVWTGAEQLTLGGAALLLSISLLLASITTYGLEKPLNAALVAVRANRPILVGALALLVAAGGVSLFSGNHLASAQAAALSRDEIDPVSHPGAAALAGELVLPDRYSVPFPAPEAVAADIPDIYGRGCTQTHRSEAGSDEVLICEYRAPGYDISVDPTIAIIGGSKSGQWNPAFKMLAEENKWRVLTLDKGGCQFTFTSENDTEPLQSEHCQRYNNNALELLQGMKPELVVTIATTARHTGERMPDGFIAAWEALDAAGIPILAIRDTPRFNWDVAECLVQNSYDAHKCGAPRSEVLPKDFSDVLAGKQLPASVTVLDMTDYFCTSDYCEAVVGNIAVYRDKHHVTVSYMDTVAPLLADKMRPEFSELFQASGG